MDNKSLLLALAAVLVAAASSDKKTASSAVQNTNSPTYTPQPQAVGSTSTQVSDTNGDVTITATPQSYKPAVPLQTEQTTNTNADVTLADGTPIHITSILDNPMIPGLPTIEFPPPNLALLADDIQRTRELAGQTASGPTARQWQVDIDWANYALDFYNQGIYPAPISLDQWRRSHDV